MLSIALTPLAEAIVEQPLAPSYSYFCGYKPGSALPPHRDRDACQVTIGLAVASHGAPWPLQVESDLGVVNCLAPVLATMRTRRAGHIAIVASVAGYGGLPTAAAYGPTKAALINMAQSLKLDCDRLGIKLQLVNPGFVKTPLTDRNEFPMPFLIPVEAAVDALVAGLASNRFEITFPRRFAFMLKALNLLPYAAYFAAIRRITGK